MNLQDIYDEMQDDLKLIESELYRVIESSQSRTIREAGIHLLEAGGKRLRPLYALLSGRLGDYQLDNIKKVAVPLELIHMATLVHDDVIDESEIRRGRNTVKSEWDDQVAVYVGDFILAEALKYITQMKDVSAHRLLAYTLVEMSVGEIEQLRHFHDDNQSLKHYLRRIKRKTALLIAASCSLGGLAGRLPEEQVQKLYLYGCWVGMAFQITDDVLDIVGDPQKSGKPTGNDLRQGNFSLPVIYVLHQSEARKHILPLLQEGRDYGYTDSLISQIIEKVVTYGGIEQAERLALHYLEKAQHALEFLPSSQARDFLSFLAYSVVGRSR